MSPAADDNRACLRRSGVVAGGRLALSFRCRSRAQVFGTAVPCVHPYGYDGYQTVEGNRQQQRIVRIRGKARTLWANNMAPFEGSVWFQKGDHKLPYATTGFRRHLTFASCACSAST